MTNSCSCRVDSGSVDGECRIWKALALLLLHRKDMKPISSKDQAVLIPDPLLDSSEVKACRMRLVIVHSDPLSWSWQMRADDALKMSGARSQSAKKFLGSDYLNGFNTNHDSSHISSTWGCNGGPYNHIRTVLAGTRTFDSRCPPRLGMLAADSSPSNSLQCKYRPTSDQNSYLTGRTGSDDPDAAMTKRRLRC